MLIPVQPSPYDVWSCADLVDILEARRTVTDGLPHAAFVVSRAITKHETLQRGIEGTRRLRPARP